MPVHRGRKIVDARPHSVEAGVGSLPLMSTNSNQHGARRVMASGVEGISVADNVITESAPSPSSTQLPAAPQHFTVPAAVLQRIQQQQQQSHVSSSAVPNNKAHDSLTGSSTDGATHQQQQQQHQHHASSHSATSLPTETHSAQKSKTASTATPTEMVADEEVTEADIAATVAALKTASTHHSQDEMNALAKAPHPATLLSRRATSDEGEDPQAVSAPLTSVAARPKPVIFSHQWRRQLFASAGASLPLPPSSKHHCHSSADEEGEEKEEDEDDFASPFGNASVIKFHAAEKEARPGSGPPPGVTAVQSSSSSSSSGGDVSEDRSRGGGVTESTGEVLCRSGSQLRTRRERHAQRQQALEARERVRVQRHMSGFDKEFLQQQEAQLLQEPQEDEESSSVAYSEETSLNDVDEEGGDGEEDSEDEVETASGSGSADEESEGDAASVQGSAASVLENDKESAPPHGKAQRASGGGFGAMKRARQQDAERRQHARDNSDNASNANHHSTMSSAAASPTSVTSALAPDSIGTRSHWFDTFFFAVHENRLRKGGCHHTLMGLRGPVTIHGPCGLIGFGLGEVCVNGFYLGKKQMNLWHEQHRAVLTPMKKLKTKHAQDMELPSWTHVPDPVWPPASHRLQNENNSSNSGSIGEVCGLGRPLNPCHYSVVSPSQQTRQEQSSEPNTGTGNNIDATNEGENEESFLQSLQWNCETVFGEIDWDWVEATVQSWRNLFSNKLPPILLVVQPSSSVARPRGVLGPMRKFYLSRKRNRCGRSKATQHGRADAQDSSAGAYMDIPAFVAHRRETSVDLALLPSVVPAVAAQGCGAVMVLGSANIGKSTLCRFLTNVLLSQHGLCYWLDLDLGQPEFGVPGQLSLVMVRRPLLRERDSSCVRTVASFFVGANTAVQCPLSTANALATICAQAAAVARAHPVVVNTHGWVLQTGRRVSVEALRRLRPRQVIHLYKEREQAWAQDTAALLDPRNGLNADVVQRRFLVRRRVTGANVDGANSGQDVRRAGDRDGGKGRQQVEGRPFAPPSAALLCRLPFPDAFDVPGGGAASQPESPTSPRANTHKKNGSNKGGSGKGNASTSLTWRGQVHAVRVEREETYSSLELLKATKGSRGRRQRWQTYFAPLVRFYAQRNAGTDLEGQKGRKNKIKDHAEPETTLLEAPLSSLRSIVLADRDEKAGDVLLVSPDAAKAASFSTSSAAAGRSNVHAEVAAALEHAVVAVLFHTPSEAAASSSSPCHGGCVVRSLASLPCGFPVSCYGVVESGEQELLRGKDSTEGGGADAGGHGWIRLRVPLRPAVVTAMLQAPNASVSGEGKRGAKASGDSAAAAAALGRTQVSIAYSAVLRQDTSFVDV